MAPPLLLPPPLEPLRPADTGRPRAWEPISPPEILQITDPIRIAKKHIEGGYGCEQAVLAAFAYRYGLSEKEIRSIASGFGGGVVLGLHCWDDEAEVSSTKELIDLKIPQEPRFHPKYWSQPFG